MEIKSVLGMASQILDEERSSPTVSYEPRSQPAGIPDPVGIIPVTLA
jgi:hypothetical protein